MIAELGHYALVLALSVALVQATVPLIGAWRGITGWIGLARPRCHRAVPAGNRGLRRTNLCLCNL